MTATSVHADVVHGSRDLLRAAGIGHACHLIPLAGGRNNRVFLVEAPRNRFVLKAYYHHADDRRDRLDTEFAFASFAWRHGLRCLAEPIACDQVNRLALFRCLPGRRIETPTPDAVRQAIAFFLRLNDVRNRAGAENLPIASEACFCLADHLDHVQRRVERLERIDAASPPGREASDFVWQELQPTAATVLARASERCCAAGLSLQAVVPVQERLLSASDFGFHNALRDDEGVIRFLDFEYAGWDDPAKMACDFFCQPTCPAPAESFAEFVAAAVQHTANPWLNTARIEFLLPVCQLKWCCIMLNDFLPRDEERRRFALTAEDCDCRLRGQLQKARMTLARLTAQAMQPSVPAAC
jgi:hypothetical protein